VPGATRPPSSGLQQWPGRQAHTAALWLARAACPSAAVAAGWLWPTAWAVAPGVDDEAGSGAAPPAGPPPGTWPPCRRGAAAAAATPRAGIEGADAAAGAAARARGPRPAPQPRCAARALAGFRTTGVAMPCLAACTGHCESRRGGARGGAGRHTPGGPGRGAGSCWARPAAGGRRGGGQGQGLMPDASADAPPPAAGWPAPRLSSPAGSVLARLPARQSEPPGGRPAAPPAETGHAQGTCLGPAPPRRWRREA
jgi:hypothetical protein